MLELSEPVPGVTRIHMWNRVGRALGFTVSAYLAHGVLVDTGFPGAREGLRALLESRRVEGAIVTHAHEDHGGNADLLAGMGIPIGGGASTLASLHERPSLHYHRRLVWGTPDALRGAAETFDDDRMRLIHAPGHTDDHHVIWDATEGRLFGGDLFLGVKVRVAHGDEDPRTLVRTLRSLAALEPAVLLDAHRGAVPRPAPLLRAKADWMEELITETDALTERGVDDAEIRRRLLGGEGWMGWGTRGEYSAMTLVHTIQARRDARGSVLGDAAPARARGTDGDERDDSHDSRD